MKYFVMFMILTSFYSCILLTDGYKKFQTFDEYKLEGVSNNENLEYPFVYVKKDIDSITVIISNDIKNKIHYVNKGEYWYSITKDQLKRSNIYKSATIP